MDAIVDKIRPNPKQEHPLMPRSPLFSALACSATLLLVLGLGCTDPSVAAAAPKPGALVVSQLLYRSGSDSLEWLEIRNDGEGPAVVAGVEIAAVGYKFPGRSPTLAPGARLVLTNDPTLFAQRHPGATIDGVYTGRLANEGEEVELDGAEGADFTFKYDRREPWPAGPGSVGTSLVFRGGDPSLPGSWASSARAGGSPGATPALALDKRIWISEVRPADADGNGFVELASDAVEPVDLSGWIVARSWGSPLADTLASGTVLAANERLVLRQQPGSGETGWGSLWPTSAADELALVEPSSDGAPTGNVHTLAWSPVPEGMSAGRIGPVGPDAGIALVASPTPGLPDHARRTGLATLAEICFHPGGDEAEFVEILNETDSVIHLGYPADTARSWSLSGVGKTFLATDTLAPRGRMVLVAKDDMDVDGFRSRWKIPASVPVLAFSGKLDNAGERLELRRPAIPVAKGAGLSWAPLVEDAATWSERAPWPTTTGGGGDCLQRIATALPGTSPAAWTAAPPTPGK